MRCTHDPASPWAYAAHRRKNEPTCPASRKAWATYMRTFRYRTGRVQNKLTPITPERTQP